MSDGGDCRTAPATPGLLIIPNLNQLELGVMMPFNQNG